MPPSARDVTGLLQAWRDSASDVLPRVDARKCRVAGLRCFGGLTVEERAAVLAVSAETVARDWRIATPWLLHETAWGMPSRGPQFARRTNRAGGRT